jgi:hypothetical protein
MGLMGMKLCVLFIFSVLPWISRVGDWALRWTEGDERIQVFFVMLFFPVVMNAIQYYIIDSFIKEQKPTDHQPLPSEDGRDSTDGHEDAARSTSSDLDPSRLSSESLLSNNSHLEERYPKSGTRGKVTSKSKLAEINNSTVQHGKEYDPTIDGADRSIVTSSGSSRSDQDTLIPGIESKNGKEAAS